jgi:glycosyltransferase involved in cell wall biosynthesis
VSATTRVLVVSRSLPVPGANGSVAYMLDLVGHLRASRCAVEYIVLGGVPGERVPWYVLPVEVRDLRVRVIGHGRVERVLLDLSPRAWARSLVHHVTPALGHRVRNAARRMGAAGDGTAPAGPETWTGLPTAGELALVERRIRAFAPHVVIADYVWLAPVLGIVPSGTLRLLLTHDVFHEREATYRAAGLSGDRPYWADARVERAHLVTADVLLAVHDEDAKTLAAFVPEREVIAAPMSARPHVHDPRAQRPGRALFVGGRGAHNASGVRWFLERVWPAVLAGAPHATFHVCGSVCDELDTPSRNVRFLGWVPGLEAEYAAAEVCVVPATIGSGLKIKLVDALAHGRACVSTRLGVRGLTDAAGRAVVVADGPTDFARAALALFADADRRRACEEEARRYVRERLSPATAYGPLIERIGEHVARTRPVSA